jgi:hypothetical protein
MDTLQFQQRWPELHSDTVREAIRCIPSDVAVAMPAEWLDATVRGISEGLGRAGYRARASERKLVQKEMANDQSN